MEQVIEQATSVEALLQKRPLIISGPCSAETEEQVMQTALRLAATGKVDILRAGIWKPRTRPGSFEGIGTKGLPWLQAARKASGLPVAVEVATGKQVEDALHFGVDVLWIGARTTVNPFSVQDVADALRGVDVPVLIKNPINPDLELWIGAMERVAKAGIKHIGLIHRGFSSYGNTEYRNAPMWHLAIEMKRRYPELLMINDPSHICGRRDILQEVAQTAIDLDFDGLIVESHIDPDNAWSDAKQQITPEKLGEMISSIRWRKEDVASPEYHAALEKLRQQINNLDDELMQILGQRMKVAESIGKYKKENDITILQTNRWNSILERAFAKGDKLGLSKEFVTKYFDAVHMESINHQNKIMNS
ncbi:MAG: bifunctional 3-deoxy-7-phosphoheptulonate synthase/chorismate mutase type II [Chitinophagaceae bacterium]|nr:bifunctional 3-deoxy-7-phosphoheptulonate synthase/chorismate mutase type II [Chitinophagaceae bacterium]MEA3427223.1 chorismate mutase [Bacteroidota bacterium]MCA6452865.1 bifunctional 3-deoxy-7-phosphoheptulonate synthase/chorismate mutase type II [Chitinophagaceae bacterium]MCA6454808.1 bifunctional 3-deoxy-7-phosphoheptulonate synthase/chorismate mutase type II [Chitinophagaceae bacterium]MCA6459399.1 bifunctional 3-deoxy-7-phosphoheptulonate synthase/chorismate mutase type II [Chitinoph